MTDQFVDANKMVSITPPPELVEEWRNLPEYVSQLRTMSTVTITTERLQDIATQAARWGADQELQACVEWASCFNYDDYHYDEVLRDIRRPKPPSLKEQALAKLPEHPENMAGHWKLTPGAVALIRRALEALDD